MGRSEFVVDPPCDAEGRVGWATLDCERISESNRLKG